MVVCCNPQCDPYVSALEKENLDFLEERLQDIGSGGYCQFRTSLSEKLEDAQFLA